MGVDVDAAARRARVEMAEACRLARGQPGARARPRRSARAGGTGRDKVCIAPNPARLRPVGRAADRRVDRQARQGARAGARASRPTGRTGRRRRCGSPTRTSSAQEFFRWEFATAVAGSILGINPFDQPNVQAAKDKTNEVLASGDDPQRRAGGLGRRAASRRREPGDYVCDPGVRRTRRRRTRRGCVALADARARGDGLRRHARLRAALPPLDRPAAQGRAATRGSSCRSSTTPATSSPIPGQPFGFGRLIRAQAAGDFASLQERGRRVARVRLEDI